MDSSVFTISRIDFANIVLATVFLFFGIACGVVATIRQRHQVRILVWMSLWSGMYGAALLLSVPHAEAMLPYALRKCVPFTGNAINLLLVVAALLAWSELTLGKLRRVILGMTIPGIIIGAAGIGWFIATGSGGPFYALNNLLAVCALLILSVVIFTPGLSTRFLIHKNSSLVAGTLVFLADALFRNVWGVLNLPRVNLPLMDELAFACFLFSFAYVAAQKVFANERRLFAIENELEIARQIQASTLPASPPEIKNLQIAALYQPMAAVGGDFYEFVVIDECHAGFVVADVTGHGVPAAMISAMLKVAMQSVIRCANQPSKVLGGLNEILASQLRGQFITAAYLWLDMENQIGLYSAAGHPPLVRLLKGKVERMECNGLLFGVMPDTEYPVRAMSIERGDRLLLYTDGLVEPENVAAEPFGDHALEKVLLDCQDQAPDKLLDRLLAEVRLWLPASLALQDDITMVAIDFL